MSGWGGVVLSGLAGAAEGVGHSGAEDLLEKQKQDALALRDATLAKLAQETHAANATATQNAEIASIPARTDATEAAAAKNAPAANQRAVDAYKAMTPAEVDRTRQNDAVKPTVVADGSRLVVDGKVVTESQPKPMSDEEKALNKAEINLKNAQAQYYSKKGAGGEKDDTKVIPNPVWGDKADAGPMGQTVRIEPTTGWKRIETEGKAEVPEDKGILNSGWRGKPAKPATLPTSIYYDESNKPRTQQEFIDRYMELKAPGAATRARKEASSDPEPSDNTTPSTLPANPHGAVVAHGVTKAGQKMVKYADGFVEPE